MNSRIDPARFLRLSLMADAVVCGVTGLALLAAPAAIASLMGLPSPPVLAGMGVAFAGYGLALARIARGQTLRRAEAVVPIVLNAAWLLGTVAVLAAGWLSGQGNRILLLVADVVLALTILEAIGLRRLTAAGTAARAPA